MHYSAKPSEVSTSIYAPLMSSNASTIKENFKSAFTFEYRRVAYSSLHHSRSIRRQNISQSDDADAIYDFSASPSSFNHSFISNTPHTKRRWQSSGSYSRPMWQNPRQRRIPECARACRKLKICQLIFWLKSSHRLWIPRIRVKQWHFRPWA